MSVQTSYVVAPAAAYAGMLHGSAPRYIRTMVNAEASAAIPFGTPVVQKVSGQATDRDGVLPSASTDKFAGILVHSHDYARTFTLPDGSTAGDLNGTGLVPGAELAVLAAGEIWVKSFDAVNVDDAVYFAYSSGGAHYTAASQIGNTADAGHATLITNAEWRSSCAAGGFARLFLGAKVA